jgi:hypothetical protein
MAITFGDIEDALRVYLNGELTVDAYVSIPPSRPDSFVSIVRNGGIKRDLVTDSATVTFDAWAQTPSAAHDLAQEVRAAVHDLPGSVIGQMTVYRVQEFGGPANLPDPVSNQPRYTLTLSIDVRALP